MDDERKAAAQAIQRYLDSREDFAEARSEHFAETERFLAAFGWRRTCDTPGSLWLWEKKLRDGRIILVSQDVAIRAIQDEEWELFDQLDPGEDE